MTRFIGIASVKGGVGKTTTALNLATALSGFKDVVVVDTAIAAPNVSLQLGAADLPLTLHEVLVNDRHIKEALYKHPSGLKVIPGNIHFTDFENIDSELLKNKLLSLHDTSDIVILDMSSNMEEFSKTASAIDELLVVTTPDWVAVNNAAKTIHLAESMGITVLGVVLNKVQEQSAISAEEVERLLSKPIFGEIPYDEKVNSAIFAGHPVVHYHPNAKATAAYKKLAKQVGGL